MPKWTDVLAGAVGSGIQAADERKKFEETMAHEENKLKAENAFRAMQMEKLNRQIDLQEEGLKAEQKAAYDMNIRERMKMFQSGYFEADPDDPMIQSARIPLTSADELREMFGEGVYIPDGHYLDVQGARRLEMLKLMLQEQARQDAKERPFNNADALTRELDSVPGAGNIVNVNQVRPRTWSEQIDARLQEVNPNLQDETLRGAKLGLRGIDPTGFMGNLLDMVTTNPGERQEEIEGRYERKPTFIPNEKMAVERLDKLTDLVVRANSLAANNPQLSEHEGLKGIRNALVRTALQLEGQDIPVAPRTQALLQSLQRQRESAYVDFQMKKKAAVDASQKQYKDNEDLLNEALANLELQYSDAAFNAEFETQPVLTHMVGKRVYNSR